MNKLNSFLIAILSISVLLPYILLKRNATDQNNEIFALKDFHKFLQNEFKVVENIYIKFGDAGFNFPDLIEATKIQLEYAFDSKVFSNWKYEIVDCLRKDCEDYVEENCYSVDLKLGSENFVIYSNIYPNVELVYSLRSIHENDLPFLLTQAIVDHLLISDKEAIEYGAAYAHADISTIAVFSKNSKNFNVNRDEFISRLKIELQSLLYPENSKNRLQMKFEDWKELNIERKRSDLELIFTDANDEYNSYIVADDLSKSQFIIPVSGEDESNVLAEILNEIQKIVGFPQNPSTNLNIRKKSYQKYGATHLMMEIINRSISLKQRSLVLSENEKKYLDNIVNGIYYLADIIHNNSSNHNWENYYDELKRSLRQLQYIEDTT